jgi:hypothetical protein
MMPFDSDDKARRFQKEIFEEGQKTQLEMANSAYLLRCLSGLEKAPAELKDETEIWSLPTFLALVMLFILAIIAGIWLGNTCVVLH